MAYNRQDFYYKKAKNKGYRARSAFKLEQIQHKFGVISWGNVVVDLGAAPGGWSQIASKIVGKNGKIIAVDIKPIKSFHNITNIIILQINMQSSQLLEYLGKEINKPIDVVLSDLAGNTSGNWHLDSERQIYLASLAFQIASTILNKGGNFVTKVFRGSTLNEFEAEIQASFAKIKHWRPPATRKKSAEEYVICKGFIGSRDNS